MAPSDRLRSKIKIPALGALLLLNPIWAPSAWTSEAAPERTPILQLLPDAEFSAACSTEGRELAEWMSGAWAGTLMMGLQDASVPDRGPQYQEIDPKKALKEYLRHILKPLWPQPDGGPTSVQDLRQKLIEQLERSKSNCPGAGKPFHDQCISTIDNYIRALRESKESDFCLLDPCRLINRLIRLLKFMESHPAIFDQNGDGLISLDELLDALLDALMDKNPTPKQRRLREILKELIEYYAKCEPFSESD